MCRKSVLAFLLLSSIDASSGQSTQSGRLDEAASPWKQIAAVRMTRGGCYRSDYFNFTYCLPDHFVNRTEDFKNEYRALRQKYHADLSTSPILLHAQMPPEESAESGVEITITADTLSRYDGITQRGFMQRTAKSMTVAGDDVLEQGKEVEISGWTFLRADYKISQPKIRYLTVMVAFRKDFALLWQISAHSKKEVDSIAGVMQRKLITR